MSEENKKVEQIEKETKSPELRELDLDEAAGGTAGEPLQGIDVSIGRKPKQQSII